MKENEDLSLFDLVLIILKHSVLIVVSCLLFGLLAFGYVKFKNSSAPYVAKTSIVIYDPSRTKYDQYGVYNKDLNRMDTYEKIAGNSIVLGQVKSAINNNKYTASDISKAVSISKVPQTTILSIDAKTNKKSDSVKIANATALAVKKSLNKYINAGKINILGSASKKNVKRDLLSSKKYAVVGVAFGLVVSVMFVLIKDVLYKQFKERK